MCVVFIGWPISAQQNRIAQTNIKQNEKSIQKYLRLIKHKKGTQLLYSMFVIEQTWLFAFKTLGAESISEIFHIFTSLCITLCEIGKSLCSNSTKKRHQHKKKPMKICINKRNAFEKRDVLGDRLILHMAHYEAYEMFFVFNSQCFVHFAFRDHSIIARHENALYFVYISSK